MDNDKLKSGLLGAIAGLVAGVLMAPKAGKETREDIKQTYEKLHGDMAEKLSKVKGVTKETYSEVVDQVLKSYEKDKKITREEAEEVRKSLAEGFEKIKDKMNKE